MLIVNSIVQVCCSMAFEGVWDMYPECSFMYTRGRTITCTLLCLLQTKILHEDIELLLSRAVLVHFLLSRWLCKDYEAVAVALILFVWLETAKAPLRLAI